MAEGGRGRGRCKDLVERLNQLQVSSDANQAASTTASPGSTVTPSLETSTTSSQVSGLSMAGRGRAFLSRHTTQRPGDVAGAQIAGAGSLASPPAPGPAATPPPVGAGRGRGALLANLKRIESSSSSGTSSDVSRPGSGGTASSVGQVESSSLVSQVTTTSTSTLRPKNKYIREVKDTPPVVKRGETGQPCNLTANFIRLSVEPGKGVFEYEVRFEPYEDLKGHRIKMLNMHPDVLGRTKTFDGTTLYLPMELQQEVTELKCQHPAEDHTVKILVIYRRQRRMGEVVHLYNVLLKNIMRELELVRFGRQHYDPTSAIMIPQHKLEVWPGYITAVDEYEGGLMLTLDAMHRVLRTQTVLQLMRELLARDRVHWQENVTQALFGCSVMTTYTKTLYRVDDLAKDMTPLSKFKQRDGKEVSFVEYYKKHYGIEILDLDQPLLISRQKRLTRKPDGSEEKVEVMVNLVPELCQLTGLSEDMRTNFRLMKDVATYTRITPNQRMYAFKRFLENVNSNENCRTLLAKWGLKMATDTVPLKGRTLPPENITFGNGKVARGSNNADWSRDATNSNVIEAVDILNWVVLYTKKDTGCTQDFIDTLKRCGPPMGIKVNPPQKILLPSDSNSVYAQHLSQCINSSIQLVVAICPTSRDDRYAVIKKICNCTHPIPSQVINARTIMNREKVRSVVQKIALQINCKLGGTLWSINIPFKSAMIIGIDSYHEPARRNRSVAGFVASFNAAFTHWYSRVVMQGRGQELVDGLKSCLCDALKHYHSVNNYFPDKVILYRDGVGDGQLGELMDHEIPQLKSCFEMVPDYSPSLTFVVVQKRINTRLFMKLNGNELANPPPGTILDYDITRRDWYDFLVVPQKVNQGTVTPSHYIVLHDSSGMSPDQVQRLTFKLCHLYYNWPGTIRVPAPCQYAHKLAFLVGENMKDHHSMVLADKLFFL